MSDTETRPDVVLRPARASRCDSLAESFRDGREFEKTLDANLAVFSSDTSMLSK